MRDLLIVPPGVKAEIDALAASPEDKISTDHMPEVRNWDDAKRGEFHLLYCLNP
jgi:hypothetical protein